MLINNLVKFKNFDSFYDLYPQKRSISREENQIKNIFKAISLRDQNNTLLYDFASLSVKKGRDLFSGEINFSYSPYFGILLRQNIEIERSKGTTAIILKVGSQDDGVIQAANKCGFRRVSVSSDFLLLKYPLGVDPARE